MCKIFKSRRWVLLLFMGRLIPEHILLQDFALALAGLLLHRPYLSALGSISYIVALQVLKLRSIITFMIMYSHKAISIVKSDFPQQPLLCDSVYQSRMTTSGDSVLLPLEGWLPKVS